MPTTREFVQPGDVHRASFSVERRAQPNGSKVYERAVTLAPTGWCDCADIAVIAPNPNWVGVVQWRVLYRTGTVYHLSGSGTIGVVGMYTSQGNVSGVIHRIRGVHFDEIVVEYRAPGGPFDVGLFRASAWARSGWPWQETLDALIIGGEIPVLSRPISGLASRSAGQLTNKGLTSTKPFAVLGAHIANLGATDVWIQFWDRIAIPVAGSVPTFKPLLIPANTSGVSVEWPALEMTTGGFWWATSSTAATYTAPAPDAPLWVDVFYHLV